MGVRLVDGAHRGASVEEQESGDACSWGVTDAEEGGWKERVGRDKLSWKERSSVARAHEVVGCAVWSEEEGLVVHELDYEEFVVTNHWVGEVSMD